MTETQSRAGRQEQTRAALRRAAAELIAERGYSAASLEAISKRAGLTRGAFYANYDSKEELFAEVLQRQAYDQYREFADREGRALPSPRETGERLAAMLAAPEAAWAFPLWLELLAHSGREPAFRQL